MSKGGKINKKIKKIKKEVKKVVAKERTKSQRLSKATGARRLKKKTGYGNFLRTAGTALGGYFGAPGLGRMAGSAISRIFGQGAYQVVPTQSSSGMPPAFGNPEEGYMIAHREYLFDVDSSTDFNSIILRLNPGLSETFPWLSQIAVNFEEYEFVGLAFYLKTNSATAVASTNTALGTWGLVTQYDANDANFVDKRECENYVGCTNTVPCESVLHGVECKKSANVLKQRYVRSGDLADNEDLKFYDMGKTTVFTQGSQAVATIGELWVSYKVVFKKPKLPVGGSADRNKVFYVTSASDAAPWGTTTNLGRGSLSVTLQGGNDRLAFPSWCTDGTYMIISVWWGSSGTPTAYTPTASGSLTLVNQLISGGASNISFEETAHASLICTVEKRGATTGYLTIAGGTVPSGVTPTVYVYPMEDNSLQTFQRKVDMNNKLSISEISLLRQLLQKHKDMEDDAGSCSDEILEFGREMTPQISSKSLVSVSKHSKKIVSGKV